MRLVIDTNVMVESITSRSPYYKIFQSFVQGKNEIVISNAILLEYFDVFGRIYSDQTINYLNNIFDHSTHIIQIDPHYKFHLIKSDEDDNKFVDCAICGNCDYLITSDHHFDVLENIEFPEVRVISPEEFVEKYLNE